MDILKKVKSFPDVYGVYIMKDRKGKILYIGKASSLKKRVSSYLYKGVFSPNKELLMRDVADIDYIICESEAKAFLLEAALIKEKKPKYNIVLRDDKSYPYVEITNEEFPRIGITRTRNRKSIYLGPFPQVKLLKEALNLIRKNIGFRSCYNLPKKACLFFHLGLCPAPCIGRITSEEYKKNIQFIYMILKGQRRDLLDFLRKKMEEATSQLKFEEAGYFRDKIASLSSLYGAGEEFLELLSLKDILELKKLPFRIEAMDISDIGGSFSTGSIVVFEGGLPKKSDYRRFRIKKVEGINDTAKVAEVAQRRYKRLKEEGGILPDLIIVDGGKAQVRAVRGELRRLKLFLPVIGISKKQEEVWRLEKKESLRLPVGSPALRLIQRIRDESHRFAHKYHLLLRKKSYYVQEAKKQR